MRGTPGADGTAGRFSTKLVPQLWTALRRPGGWRRLLENVRLDLRYGGRVLGGAIANPGNAQGFFHTANTDYRVLSRYFAALELREDDVIVDVGCGKGRLFNFLLSLGVRNRAIGIEINPAVARFTRRRLRRYPQFEIVEANVLELPAIPGTVLFLFNPFSREIMARFLARLETRSTGGESRGRPVVLYRNAEDLDLFQQSGFWRVLRRFTPVEVDARHGGAVLEFTGSRE